MTREDGSTRYPGPSRNRPRREFDRPREWQTHEVDDVRGRIRQHLTYGEAHLDAPQKRQPVHQSEVAPDGS